MLDALEQHVESLLGLGPDELQDGECRDELARVEVVVRRLQARQTVMVGVVSERARRAATQRRRDGDLHGKDLAARQACRRAAELLVDELNWTPSEARRAERTAGQLDAHPRVASAFADGEISRQHVTLAADVLRHFDGDLAADLEAELVEVAVGADPVTFSKHCRRRLTELRYDVAVKDERLRRSRRSVRMTTGVDGMLHLSAHLAGLEAETVAAAVKGFRRPDTSDVAVQDRRTPDQVTADALVEMCEVALGAADNPRRHATRPHVVVTIDWETIAAGGGTVQTDELGTLPFDQVRRILADAGVSRILTDAARVPLEAGRQVRTVPVGLWRALKLRDDGCIVPTCSIPAEWCQVAHLDQPYRLDGRLSPLNAALLCTQHHGLFDHEGWRIVWEGNRPFLHPPLRNRDPDAPGPPASPLSVKPSAMSAAVPVGAGRSDREGAPPDCVSEQRARYTVHRCRGTPQVRGSPRARPRSGVPRSLPPSVAHAQLRQ